MPGCKDDGTELLIDLLQGALEEEGYQTKRYSDSGRFKTTAYDAIEIKGYDGYYYTITVDKREEYRDPRDGRMHPINEVFTLI